MPENTPVEIIRPWSGLSIRYALFDFDGTVSLIREGWQAVMIPYFMEVLRDTKPEEPEEEIRAVVRNFVDTLTGKQTIFQCVRLNEEVVKRGGPARDPLVYKREYLRRLETRIHGRKERLARGETPPDTYLVPGIQTFLQLLKDHGIHCYLASGTDEVDVLEEARLLALDGMFDGGIHGARDEVRICSKELVIRDMMEREKILPRELVSFGDGYVEVELVSGLGGLSIGAATNEDSRQGINAWKRLRLIRAGASAIIPDFRAGEELFKVIGGDTDAFPSV